MTNPFEDKNGAYVVLCNNEEQYCLWPSATAIPEGWTKRFGSESRSDCLKFVEKNWTDMRPASLARQMSSSVTETR
jgi:uncharacterized protein YbdZ (MbtH family)